MQLLEDQTTSRGVTCKGSFVDAEYPPHPEAVWMPRRTEAEFSALKAGIEAIGLQIPIKVLKGTSYLLDGSDRLRASRELRRTPTVEYVEIPEGSSVAIYTAVEGAKRKGLTTTQKVLLALNVMPELKKLAAERQRVGARVREGEENSKASKQAADMFGVSARSVEYALKIQRKRPALFQRMRDGDLELRAARKEMEPNGKAPNTKKPKKPADDDRLFIPEYLRKRFENVMKAVGADTPDDALKALLDFAASEEGWQQFAHSRRGL
jgi:hypothetical protein